MVMKAWAMGKGRLSGPPDSKHSFIRDRPCFPQKRQTYRSRCSGTSTSWDSRETATGPSSPEGLSQNPQSRTAAPAGFCRTAASDCQAEPSESQRFHVIDSQTHGSFNCSRWSQVRGQQTKSGLHHRNQTSRTMKVQSASFNKCLVSD